MQKETLQMAVTEDLIVQISADTAKAAIEISDLNKTVRDLSKSFDKMGNSTQNIEGSVNSLGSKIVILNQAFELARKSISAIAAPISKMVMDFLKSEDVADSLGKTLAILGDVNISKTVDRFSALGDSLENITNTDKDVVLSLAKAGATFGLTNDQIEKFIKTAVDLSAVTGDDVTNSFQVLINAMQGNIRSLGPLKVLVSDLSNAQLMAGQATDVLSEKLNGLGAEKAQSNLGRFETILRKLGDLGKSIGEIIVKGLDLSALQNTSITILDNLNKSLNEIKPNLIETLSTGKKAIESILDLFGKLQNILSDFKNIFDDSNKSIQAFSTSVIVVLGSVTTLGILFSGSFFAAVSAIVVKFSELAIAVFTSASNMALMTVKIIAVTGTIATLITFIELLVNNINEIGNVWTTVWTSIVTGIGIIIEKFSGLIGLGDKFKNVFGGFLDTVAEKGATAAENLDFGKSGQIFQAVTSTFSSGLKGVEQSSKDLNKALDETGKTGRKTLGGMGLLSEQGKALLDELKKKVGDLQKILNETGASEGEKIALNQKAKLMDLALLEEKLKKEGALTKIAKTQLDQAKKLIAATAAKEKADLGKKNLDDQIKLTKQLAGEIASKDALTIDLINMKKQADLDELAKQKEILSRDKEINKAALEQIAANEKLIKLKAAQDIEAAPSREYEGAKKAGEKAAEGITAAFQSGTTGAVMGAMEGAMAIADVIQGLIDFIPGMLDKISNIFTSLLDLPTKIADGFQKLSDAILDFVSNIVSRIGSMLIRLPDILLEFVTKLPEAVDQFVQQIPEVLTKLIDRLPEVIPKLLPALIALVPKIAYALSVELTKVIINWLVDSIKKALPNLFKSASRELIPKPADIAKSFSLALKSVSKNLTGVASKLFAVMDLEEGAKSAADKVKDFGKTAEETIGNGIENIAKASKDALQSLIDAWRWVYDNILMPIFNIVKGAWSWVYDNIISPLLSGLRQVWLIIYNNIIAPLLDGLRQVWLFIYDNVISPFLNLLTSAFDFLGQIFESGVNLLNNLAGFLMQIFDGFINGFKNLIQWISDVFGNFVNLFREAINAISDIGQKIVDGMKSALDSSGDFFKDIGKKIWDGLKDGLGGIGGIISDQLNKINPGNIFGKIFDTSGAFGDRGTIEKNLGFDMPFMSFARGGKVPGMATVAGDSLINDKILALLSPGEYVIPRSVMQDPTAQALIASLVEGNKIPQYAMGGIIGQAQEALSSILPDVSTSDLWSGIFDKVKDAIWKIFEANKFHNGGEVPALLKPGEFVINQPAASSLGTGFLNSINSGNAPSNNMNQEININLTINTSQPIDESFIKNKIYPVVREQIKRASLDGQTLIYTPGVRSI